MKGIVPIVAALLALSAAAPALADSGTAALWHLDEGSGTAVADSSGQGNDGVLNGGARWVQGRFGTALTFDGATGQVHVADNGALEPASAVSVSAWVQADGTPGQYRYIVAKGATGCIAASYGLYAGPDSGLQFYVSSRRGTSYTRSPDAGTGVWDGRWHMVVGVFDGTNVRLYVDGSEVGSGTPRPGPLEYLLPDSNDLFIGDYPGCKLHNFNGTIDEVSVWTRALTAAEVQGAYTRATQGAGSGSGQITPAPPTGSTRGAGGAQGNGTPPPVVLRLTISPRSFVTFPSRGKQATHRPTGATITYVDTQAARSTFAVLQRQLGVISRDMCVKKTKRSGNAHARSCFRYVLVGTFAHADVAGRNSFHFSGLRGRRLAAGHYRLVLTAQYRGRAGRAVSVSFVVVSG